MYKLWVHIGTSTILYHHIDWTTSRHAAAYPSALARAIARALRASIAERRFNGTTAMLADREHSSPDALGSESASGRRIARGFFRTGAMTVLGRQETDSLLLKKNGKTRYIE